MFRKMFDTAFVCHIDERRQKMYFVFTFYGSNGYLALTNISQIECSFSTVMLNEIHLSFSYHYNFVGLYQQIVYILSMFAFHSK
jgi:hypothetical protein